MHFLLEVIFAASVGVFLGLFFWFVFRAWRLARSGEEGEVKLVLDMRLVLVLLVLTVFSSIKLF